MFSFRTLILTLVLGFMSVSCASYHETPSGFHRNSDLAQQYPNQLR